MVKCCLFSISKKWSQLPKLVIISDGSITTEKIKHSLKFWKGAIQIKHWQESITYHQRKNRNAIKSYAELNPFGKKLAIILHYAEIKPVIWIDSDILFFKDFVPYFPNIDMKPACGGSADWKGSYDERLLIFFNASADEYGSLNAGLVYAYGEDLYEKYRLEEAIKYIHPNYDFLSEQTIFAEIASDSFGILWNQHIIGNYNSDNQSLRPTSGALIGRHYTSNVRHLFWRDAFYFS
ncbi:hypothetical protein [Pedobacter aquatilis]|uniref:hypothetical protein n=1 Tax=Pedobacter aquatilis TaxID=351343 RepID=UPI00292DDC51|nr:hypothetical protein [Pedobacter aquatilis]